MHTIFDSTVVTLPHNLICEAGMHYLRVKLKAEGAHRDTF